MTTGEFICNCLRLYKSMICKIDNVIESFDLDFDEVLTEDIIVDTIQQFPRDAGNQLLRIVYESIISQACEQHGDIEEEMFDMHLNDYCSVLIFNGVIVNSLEDLEDEILKVK